MELDLVGVYPYSAEFDPFLRHASLLDKTFRIKALISPYGWGLVGQTFSLETERIDLTVVSEFDTVISDIDTIFIPYFYADENMETLIIKDIEDIALFVKKIICAAKLSKQNTKILENICEAAGCIFEDLNQLTHVEQYELMDSFEENPAIENIDVPIIVIAGLWEETDKFEVSLALRKKFLQNNYKVTQIGSRNCCELFDFHSFPGFMLRSHVDAVDKIIHFNRLIKHLTENERPDIIILTIPGAIKNLSDEITKGFGILPHIIFQSIMADYLIFCTMYDECSIQFLQEISTMCKYKFDCPVDCYHMSNMLFDLAESKSRKRVVINRFDRNDVSLAVELGFKNSPISVMNILEQTSQDMLFAMIIDKLAGTDCQII
ncbi:MAG: TIGR04066 family peptide maturation system protein [Oscillospiraceae bacterium]|nr:TIGR04066 family peptide maturation system protein [Oscillospiraceae bacterium]